MADFIKAYCERSKQYYGIWVESGKVVNLTELDSEAGKSSVSAIDCNNLETADSLRPCFVCGSRRVAKCDCAEGKYSCDTNQHYRFQCIYCKQLKIFKKGKKSGEVIKVNQGGIVPLGTLCEDALEHLLIGVGWDIALQGHNMDLDSTVFVQSQSNRSRCETIYFGNLTHPSGCVVHHGDNLVGGKRAQDPDSENIDIYLNKVPSDRDELYFVLNIYKGHDRGQKFRDVRNMYICVRNAKTQEELLRFTPQAVDGGMNAIVIARVFKENGEWVFQAVNKCIDVENIERMHPYCMP